METFIAVLMGIGIFLGISTLIGLGIAGIYVWVIPRARGKSLSSLLSSLYIIIKRLPFFIRNLDENENPIDDQTIVYPPVDFTGKAYIKSLDLYKDIYRRSLENPEKFWGEQALDSPGSR